MNSSAKVLHEAAVRGFRRLRNFRAARLMFIRAFVGQYYDRTSGELGQEPLNMAFNAIRVLVPNLIARHPEPVIETDYLDYRPYGELLGLGLRYLSKKLDLPSILRDGLIDAIFTLGIFKVGLGVSNNLVYFGEESVDPGQIYVDTVDLDDLTFDPDTKTLKKAGFIGEKFRIERESALASGLFDNAVIERMPSSAAILLDSKEEVHQLSKRELNRIGTSRLHDYIDLMELWLRDANVLVTIPYEGAITNTFVREDTWYGPECGPYIPLSLSPPVPNNPLPVALAGIWHDLHYVGNRMAKKAMDQMLAQKDILLYRGSSADEAQEIVDAKNLDAVRSEDPAGAEVKSFAGANPINLQSIAQLELWFNQFSGNTNLTGGLGVNAESATEANILSQNAANSMSYMTDEVYGAAEEIYRSLAWYLHTDPLIELPLIRRNLVPAEYEITQDELMGDQVRMISPPRTEETQVFLTPEARRGDFLDFAFTIKQESMGPVNRQQRLQQLETLAIRIIPAAAQAAMIATQMGTPFSFRAFVTRAARMMNISWIDEIFQSPELIAQMAMMAQRGPQPGASKGVANMMTQNRGAPVGQTTPPQQTQQRQTAQAGAALGQSRLPGGNREIGRGTDN